jgi:integrase
MTKATKRAFIGLRSLLLGFESRCGHGRIEDKERSIFIDAKKLAEYLDVRRLEGLTDKWIYAVKLKLDAYLKYCDNRVSKRGTIEYLKFAQNKYSQATYRKHMLQIRRFLRYLELDYMENIKIISEPSYHTKRLEEDFINEAVSYFKENQQFKALILLGASTGLRPSELYRLKIEDIQIPNRSIEVKKSKTGIGRTVYFNATCREELQKYLKQFKSNKKTRYLFGEYLISRAFRDSPVRVKQLRKYFIQTWHRNSGSYPVGELLLGHSVKGNISLQHYLSFNEEEIKKEYDRVMN